MYDDGVLMRHGLSQHKLAPGATLHMTSDDAARLGLDGSAILVANGAEVKLPVMTDDSLAHGVVYVPFNQPDLPSLGSGAVVDVKPVETQAGEAG